MSVEPHKTPRYINQNNGPQKNQNNRASTQFTIFVGSEVVDVYNATKGKRCHDTPVEIAAHMHVVSRGLQVVASTLARHNRHFAIEGSGPQNTQKHQNDTKHEKSPGKAAKKMAADAFHCYLDVPGLWNRSVRGNGHSQRSRLHNTDAV